MCETTPPTPAAVNIAPRVARRVDNMMRELTMPSIRRESSRKMWASFFLGRMVTRTAMSTKTPTVMPTPTRLNMGESTMTITRVPTTSLGTQGPTTKNRTGTNQKAQVPTRFSFLSSLKLFSCLHVCPCRHLPLCELHG